MAEKRSKFYITTPIYYVNARPHVGHAYTTIVCDAVARWQRMHGVETLFLTGTDEHGVNVERSATAAGKKPKEWSDEVAARFREAFDQLNVTYDDFIRTTEDRHKRGVQALWRLIQKNGYIYRGTYTGQYCIFDNLYVDVDQPGAPCPECGRKTETISEQNYFFKLSAFADKLLQFYAANPGFIRPETRRNEVIAFVKSGLRDLSISRSTFKWGVPVPDDPGHVVYVWLDALINYISAIGFGSPEEADQEKFKRFWPADVHMMSKEIIRFHCVYWPAFLMAAGLPTPKSIIVHGHLLFEESKMSKSRGNVVRSESVVEVLGADALRYFLLREVVFGQDGSFSFDALVGRFNSDLANDLGNLASRTLTMITRYFRGEVPYPSPAVGRTAAEDSIALLAAETIASYRELFDDYQFNRALEAAWGLIAAVNKYIVETEPWAVADKPDEASRARLATILYTAAEALRVVTALVHPVIPEATAKIWTQIGLGDIREVRLDRLQWGQLALGTKLEKVEPVFPRAEKSAIEAMQKKDDRDRPAATDAAQKLPPERVTPQPQRAEATAGTPAGVGAQAGQAATQAVAAPTASASAPAGEKITIDDFTKVEMRVGVVKVAEKVKNADRLLRLEVDIGTEVRQLVAGIAKAYEPEKLIGRKVVIVANLQPRKLRGLESNGMILAASFGEDGTPALASFLEDVPIGARLK